MERNAKYETITVCIEDENASKSNREKIDMQVKLQMMENELQKHQQEKSEFAQNMLRQKKETRNRRNAPASFAVS